MNREEAIKNWIIPAISRTWNDGRCKEILSALEQEPVFFPLCQDCNTKMDEIRRAYDKLQKQEPCDAVSRKEVMNMLHNHAFDYATSTKISALLKTMRGEVDRMPSVHPECTEDYCPAAFKSVECEDAISRQAVRHILNHEVKLPIKVWKKVFELVDDLPPVTPAGKVGHWIPVSERLPEEDGCYLVTTTGTNNDIIDIAYYTDGIWHKSSRIKAWMPLPKPYKASPTVAEGSEE